MTLIRLDGTVDEAMLGVLVQGFAKLQASQPAVVQLYTLGGDAEVGRRIVAQVRLERSRRHCRFHGITAVYSAGVTIMAAFPQEGRLLIEGCTLLVHERKLTKSIELNGSLEGCLPTLKEALNQVHFGITLEREGFAELALGSRLSAPDVIERARTGWYLTAGEALEHGLVGAVLWREDACRALDDASPDANPET